MARPLRLEFENAVYHITARGNEKRDIFLDEKDFEKFLSYLALVQSRYDIIIFCFVLMNNHYHLLVQTPQPNLSKVMRDLNGHYTIYFNKRHDRNGHLFQGRYNSTVIDKDNYLTVVSRYIHLNPLRAGVVRNLEDYKWSSLVYYISEKTPPLWLNVSFILDQFGNTASIQKRAYRDFVYDEIAKFSNPFQNAYAGAILGSKDFIANIKESFLNGKDISKEIPNSKNLRYGVNLTDIANAVTAYYDVSRELLAKPKSKFNIPKKVFVYFSRRYTDSSLGRIREFLNDNVSEVAISKLSGRTHEELKNNKGLNGDIEKIRDIVFNGNKGNGNEKKKERAEDNMSHVKT